MIPEGPFKEADPVIRFYSVMELLKTAAGCAKDLGLVHAEQVEKLVDLQTGRKVSLPYGLEAPKSIRRDQPPGSNKGAFGGKNKKSPSGAFF